MTIGAILFEGFELLDLYGPLEMFGLLDDRVRITTVAMEAGAVRSSSGPSGVADASMNTCKGFDVLLIPGGIGTRREVSNAALLSELKRLAEASKIVATVCTGSYLLAATGLLDGLKATSNKRAFDMVVKSAPKVKWVRQARWVEDGKYFTSSGISAGIDMSLVLIARLLGRETSLEIARHAEYQWNEDASRDPFGSDATPP